MPAPAALVEQDLLIAIEDVCRRRGTGQAGEVMELLQSGLPGRGDVERMSATWPRRRPGASGSGERRRYRRWWCVGQGSARRPHAERSQLAGEHRTGEDRSEARPCTRCLRSKAPPAVQGLFLPLYRWGQRPTRSLPREGRGDGKAACGLEKGPVDRPTSTTFVVAFSPAGGLVLPVEIAGSKIGRAHV